MTKVEKVGFVVLSHWGSSHVRSLVESIQAHAAGVAPVLIIVENSTSGDEVRRLQCICEEIFGRYHLSMAPDFPVDETLNCHLVLCDSNEGYSVGNNIGFRYASRLGIRYACLANPDTALLDSSSLKRLFTLVSRADDVLAVFPAIVGPDGELRGSGQGPFPRYTFPVFVLGAKTLRLFGVLKTESAKTFFGGGAVTQIYTSIGCFMLLDVAKFLQLDGFDERFFLYLEEHVLGEKARRARLRMLFDHGSRVFHNHDYSAAPMQSKRYLESLAAFLKIYRRYSAPVVAIVMLIIKYKAIVVQYCNLHARSLRQHATMGSEHDVV